MDKSNHSSGFTLIELLIAIVILAILMALALPSMRDFIVANRLTSDVNSFVGLVNYARSEAITRNQRVIICPKTSASSGSTCSSSLSWNEFEIEAFVDADGTNDWSTNDVHLKTLPAIDATGLQTILTQPTGSTNKVIFGSAGFSQNALRFNIHTVKSGDTAYEEKYGRSICVSKPGRVRVVPYSATTCTAF
ncbi:MAG: hypothetical protein BWK72_03805 [Rhodoferax ferrireducens]|uniref:Type II secretion system protein H n=1 Tax=Rhodoferax ferrireducens TaxID=192843 RepID=A0A1W9KWY3_9BURK|nr:MAG: hypothetical protein BWK72_03805 [Rhodoferax ferrireducens]